MTDFPQGWVNTSLGELLEMVRGVTFTKAERQDHVSTGYVGCLRTSNVQHTLETDNLAYIPIANVRNQRQFVQQGDVIVSMSNSYELVGKAAIAEAEHQGMTFGAFLAALRSSALEPLLLLAMFRSELFLRKLRATSSQTVNIANISAKRMAELEMALPPLAEQRRIVAKIDSLTGKSRRARDQLDHISRLVEKYKQAVLALLLSSPDGQQITRFGEVADLLNGDRGQHYPNDSEQLPEGHCLFLGTRNVRQGFFDFSHTSFITREKHLALRGGTMERGDIVVTVRGTLGNCAVYDASVPYDLVRINSAMMIVRPVADADPEYLMWTIRSPVFLGWVGANARGSAQPHLRAQDIEKTEVYFPSIERQREAVQRIKNAFNWIDRLASEATSARRLIDRLDQAVLAKAFRGELVPQDPDDEPASVLLERIRSKRGAVSKVRRGRRAATMANAKP